MAESDWYCREVLTELSYDEMCAALQRIRIVDGSTYYRYLCYSLLPAARSSWRSGDGTPSPADGFMAKVFRLVALLDEQTEQKTKFYAFHALIRVAASIIRPELAIFSDCQDDRALSESQRLLNMIKDRFERPIEHRKPASIAWEPSSYWDFAAARKKLWTAWSRMKVVDHMGKSCWHVQNRELLEFVQKRAYGEIRAKVMLILGTKLPLEVAAAIFELSMAAEDAPLEVEVQDVVKEIENVECIFRSTWKVTTTRECRLCRTSISTKTATYTRTP